jgi:drug/metabolite transporter (DMT)-like permease
MILQNVVLLIIFAVGISGGQLLFKMVATRHRPEFYSNLLNWVFALCSDWTFIVALLLYGGLTLYWIWLISFIPISNAYPFTFLSMVIVTVGGALIYKEDISSFYVLGSIMVMLGLAIISSN